MKKAEKLKLKKRFAVILLSLFSIMILPIVYIQYGIEASITTAVITGIITITSIYITGQSVSDSVNDWSTKKENYVD